MGQPMALKKIKHANSIWFLGNQEKHERARARPASSDASDNESSEANGPASKQSVQDVEQ